MDYILQNINKKINFYTATKKSRELTEYYRVKVEYCLFLALGYLWNENINNIDSDTKSYVFEKIQNPSIGTVIDVSRRLDIQKELFLNKKFNNTINSYPTIRNDRVGHGYTFQDSEESYVRSISSLANSLTDAAPLFRQQHDIIVVLDQDETKYTGINYKADGVNYKPWACPKQIASFQVGSFYLFSDQKFYYRISPFIYGTSEEEFFIFRNITEILSGRVQYNQIFRTVNIMLDWSELSNVSIETTNFRRKSINGTIISVLNKNYKKYIEVGTMKKKITNFLLKDRASVCATIWGHGGVGKTATVQSICEDLANGSTKRFDYIVFTSAKDRFYNYFTGNIQEIEENTETYEAFIRHINCVICNQDTPDESLIITNQSKTLLVVDDFETFPSEEKKKIEDFIRKLDINRHKVLVTTRANLIIGDEFQTNELDLDETRAFLIEILRSEFTNDHVQNLEADLGTNDRHKLVHEITNGRPLFVYQFAYIWMQSGTIESALARNIKQEKSAIDFLYGRIYDYLSPLAKDIFVIMGQIVTDSDLTNLIEKVRYILNQENNDRFNDGIRELEKLRIIEVVESKFFRVYSKEILQTMSLYFDNRNDTFRRNTISRIPHVTKDRKLDNDQALLLNANTARVSRTEQEVISLYRGIINRSNSAFKIRLQAITNLADYLFNSRGKKDEAVKLLKDHEHLFNEEHAFSRLYATYSWATGRKEESIQILSEYCARKPMQYQEDRNIRFELTGLLITYRSLDAIQRKEELKEKRRFEEITLGEYDEENLKIKNLLFDICHQHGTYFFRALRQMEDIQRLTSGARQNIVSALYQYANVNIRLNRYGEAIEICEFAIVHFPTHFADQFRSKIDFCRRKMTYR
ncbi:NACHT domain-containing protein [Kouleothrix sp.]|mgnify:CR=1 FL=1|uniref:NACHT domain-containing protein n=1 Tax=Kouleothrix sp. TaxID=2779161 RepID=UPI003919FFB9